MYGSIHSHFESDKDAVNAHFGANGRISFVQALEEYKKLGAKKIAITEHGAFSSFEDIYHSSQQFEDLDVIPGVEAYLDYKGAPEERAHLILIAKDNVGYEQLCKLITAANKNTWTSPQKAEYPILTMDMLDEICGANKGHMLCTSACIAGPFGRNMGLDLKNIDEKLERYSATLAPHDYQTKKKALDDFAEVQAIADAMLPAKEDVLRAKETRDVALKKAQTQMRRDAREYKNTEEFLQKKADAEAADKYIKANKLRQTINLYKKAILAKEEYLKDEAEGVHLETAKQVFSRLTNVFGNDFYFELQNHNLPAEEEIYNKLVKFAFQMNHPKFIASNDIHIAMHKSNPEFSNEVERRNVAKSMRFGKFDSLDEVDTYEYGIKTDEELRDALLQIIHPIKNKTGGILISAESIVDNAIGNIQTSLESCKPYTPVKSDHYPKFAENDIELFEQLVHEGIDKKFDGKLPNEDYEKRLQHELDVIESMGYASYHLIVQDYIQYGRLLGYLPPEEIDSAPLTIEELDAYITEKGYERIGYAMGPGRGSGAGSLVCYALGITDVDPMKYNLLFERERDCAH